MEKLESTHLNKHIAAIHCSNNISLLQRKIYNALLFRAYNQLMKEDFHFISLSELSRLINYNSKDTAKLKAAFRVLQSTIVEWNILEKQEESNQDTWCSSTLLASSVIDGKRGLCRYEYSKTLASLLYQPDVYARIDLNIQKQFCSSYGLALYETCVRFKAVKTTGWISVEKFRHLMGVSESKYKKFCDFNRRVLSSAIAEINKVSDINIELQERRISQKVLSLRFHITPKHYRKALGILSQTHSKTTQSSVMSELLKEKFLAPDTEITALINNYSYNYLNEKIQIILSSTSYKQGKVQVPLALLKSALKNDYVVSSNTVENTAKRPVHKITREQNHEYEAYRKKYIMQKFTTLDQTEKRQIEELFGKHYNTSKSPSDQIIYKVYCSHGIKLVEGEFVQFATLIKPDLMSGLDTIEVYFQLAAHEKNLNR